MRRVYSAGIFDVLLSSAVQLDKTSPFANQCEIRSTHTVRTYLVVVVVVYYILAYVSDTRQ